MPSAQKLVIGTNGSIALLGHLAIFLWVMLPSLLAAETGRNITTLKASDFGVLGDGVTDDGPSIRRLIEAAAQQTGPTRWLFPSNAQVFVKSGVARYAFNLKGLSDVTIEGEGTTFELHPDLRFLHASECRRLSVRNLNVKVAGGVAAEGVISKIRQGGKELVVDLQNPALASRLGGPSGQDGEQDFFGMIWNNEGDFLDSHHYYVESTKDLGGGKVLVTGKKTLPPKWRQRLQRDPLSISLPLPGVAHRYGPGPMFRIDRCEDVEMVQVEVWSAPWFAFTIKRNRGKLVFQEVHIRPKPGTEDITSSWRDGFHVKGNSASLLFEDCIIEGTNDDAFNVSSHAWKVVKVLAPDRIRIKQIFPIQYMPMQEGGDLLILNPDGTQRLPSARIKAVDVKLPKDVFEPGERRSPPVTLTLTRPLPELEKGCVLWDLSTANPKTVIRRCVIGNSCRFQSPVTLEDCTSRALLYFYSERVEGPFPSGSVIRNCQLWKGRGNATAAVALKGWREEAPKRLPPADEFPLQNITFTGNEIHGVVKINGVNGLSWKKNQFEQGKLEVRNSVRIDK